MSQSFDPRVVEASTSSGSGYRAAALAHPNIALSKYWGKLPGEGNVPAVPSLSVTLQGLATRTTVEFDAAMREDELWLGQASDNAPTRMLGKELHRVTELLDRVRLMARDRGQPECARLRARVWSTNDFPTASGLASSASGFAALSVAASRAARLSLEPHELGQLARQSSASAARSLFGGYVELDRTTVRPVAAADALPLTVLVCVTTEEAKAVSSRDGMSLTRAESMFYPAWLSEAPKLHASLLDALCKGDFDATFALAEKSALCMHASAMAAGVVYLSGATLAALATVQSLRKKGISAYASMDAGPQLKCFVRTEHAETAQAALAACPGVLRILVATPGPGAHVVGDNELAPAAKRTLP